MATSNKSKKILEKARKVAAKTKKKKVSKVDVKKKTTSYPEGQNAPQSKKYTQEADKSLGAKNTGWRWTKEGAKKLGKDANAKPSQSDIETYRNETFKLKGKPNKSGPKGVGDGSHRYLYIERRADKADIKRSQKLAKGGETKDAWGVFYNGKLMFTESSQDEANKSAKMLKSQVDMPFGVSVEKVESKKHAKGGEIIIWVQKENTSPKELYKEVKNLNEFKKELENLKKTGYYSMGGVKKSTYDKRGFYSKGGETPKTYFEYVYWNEITDDPKDDNDGYIYGINIVDGETYEVIDVSWFKTEKERDNAIEKYGLEEVDYDSNEYAKGGYMAKGGITKDELKEFKSYVKEHYGKDEIYDEFFPPTGASNDEIELAIRMYVSYCKTKDDQWGGGDTFDREIVRDVMLYNRGRKTNLEYQRAVKEIVKHYNNKSFEYGGILEPMIGGVNADPRFDIYNTTMFAKKGAELPKGGKVKSITERAKKLLEKYIKYRWVNTDMGSGWAFTLVSPKGDVLEERTYLDFFEPEDEDSNTKYYYEQWKEDMFETSYPDFRDRVTEDNLDWFIEFLQRDEDFAKGGETKDGKIKFYKVADEIRNLQYDGDPHDKRLHSETIFSWGAKDEDEYERAEKLIGKIGEKGNGWEVYATFDYSGYDYWMKQMQEPNYITIAVIFKDSYVDENEIGRIESAVYEAIMEAERISNAFDYDPAKDKDDDDYAKGGKTKEFIDWEEIIGKKVDGWEASDNNGISIIWENPKSKYYFFATPGFGGFDKLPIQVGKENDDDFNIVMTSTNSKASYNMKAYLDDVKKVISIIDSTKGKQLTTSSFKNEFSGVEYQSYAKGGKTHEQGYDDREDESLAMRHGKISSKDFVGSHHKKEHSRRDDARFETRDK